MKIKEYNKKRWAPSSKNFQKLLTVIFEIIIIFGVLYCMQIISGDLAAVNCIMIISLFESEIQSGLIS